MKRMKHKTPLEAANALRTAAEWLMQGPMKVRIRGRMLRRTTGEVVGVTNKLGVPSTVCLLGAAWYALEEEGISDDTGQAINRLSAGNRRASVYLNEAYAAFDFGMEYTEGSKARREQFALAIDAVNAAALELEKEIKTTEEPKLAKREKKALA